MNYNKSLFLLPILLLCFTQLGAQNRLASRLYFKKPSLFISPSHIKPESLTRYKFIIEEPVDIRSKFYGEPVYKKLKTQPLKDFFELPLTLEIQKKINIDFASHQFAAVPETDIIKIYTAIEVFYPDVRGFLWITSFAKIRLKLTATLNNEVLISNVYEEFYKSNGTDKEFEGYLIMNIEQAANVTIGMTLRKILDRFYKDLEETLHSLNTEKNEK